MLFNCLSILMSMFKPRFYMSINTSVCEAASDIRARDKKKKSAKLIINGEGQVAAPQFALQEHHHNTHTATS